MHLQVIQSLWKILTADNNVVIIEYKENLHFSRDHRSIYKTLKQGRSCAPTAILVDILIPYIYIYIHVVEQLSEKIVHFLIKAPNLVQYLFDSYYFILDTVPLKILIIPCSKNLADKLNQ